MHHDSLCCHLLDTQRTLLASFAEAGESPCLSPVNDLYSQVTWWHVCDVALQFSTLFFMMEGDFPAAWSPESVRSRGSGYILCTWVSVSNTLPILKATYKAGLFVAIDLPMSEALTTMDLCSKFEIWPNILWAAWPYALCCISQFPLIIP